MTPSPLALVRQLTPAASSFRAASNAFLAGVVAQVMVIQPVGAQAPIKRTPSRFNLFSVEQDLVLGRQAATEIERQVRLVSNVRTERFLTSVVTLLAAQAPGPRYPYRVSVAPSRELNLLVLPAGPIYVSSALLAIARTEAELAGILAHSMAHIVLRHGTERASRAYLGRAGVSALGGGVNRSDDPSRIVSMVGGSGGVNAAYLTFGLSDEFEADALGAEIMSKAGYDPIAMSTLFATLRREARRNAEAKPLTRTHPPSVERENRIRNLTNVLGHYGRAEVVGGFSSIRWVGSTAPKPPGTNRKTATGTVVTETPVVNPEVPVPSSQFSRFNHADAFLAIDHPSNWDAYPSGFAISFAPAGAVIDRPTGEPNLLQGAIVNFYAPFESDVERWNNSLTRNYAPFEDRTRRRGVLEDATDDLVRQILAASTHLTAPIGSARREAFDGTKGYSVRLSGRSPVTGEVERVTVYTRALPDEHVVYLACVAPARNAAPVERACAKMVQSLRVNEAAAHR